MIEGQKFGLPEDVIGKIKIVLSHYETIEKVVIYGSRAKGNYHPGSDIDLTLFGKGIDLGLLNRLANELDDLLLPYCFDLSIYQQIDNPDLCSHIQRVGIPFYL